MGFEIINGDCLEELDKLDENSIESIVTDPPYELNFMGKGWDNAGVSFQKETWQKCLRVLKPGGYLLAFGGTRTYHRIACAIEDAGFEIRDTIMWIYGSGFPKSMSLSKGLEAREKLGNAGTRNKRKIEQACDTEEYKLKQTNNGAMGEIIETTRKEYVPGTDLAKQWQGWGTCLKPSYEPIIVARKPFKGSLVDNVLKYGVGGLNIDECRVGNEERTIPIHSNDKKEDNTLFGLHPTIQHKRKPTTQGRFPANTILTYDETDFDEVCGGFPITTSTGGSGEASRKNTFSNVYGEYNHNYVSNSLGGFNDKGSAARYFYCAKASRKDRDEGLSEGERSTHPTVKPTALMQYLVRLVSPKGATILDPFMGSGSTGKAVMYENKERNADYKFVGIEKEAEYCEIAKARIENACKK